MRVLVVGSGGREHALVASIAESPKVAKVYACPGNPGIGEHAENVPIQPTDIHGIAEYSVRNSIDLVVVGPEVPLALGLADILTYRHIPVFGPSRAAARIEWSKSFAKRLMVQAGVPTADYRAFSDEPNCLKYLESVDMPVVIKADGLAQGKGVVIAHHLEQARSAVKSLSASGRIIVEEHLRGPEASLLCIVAGESVAPLIPAQDYKRAHDGNEGPNTGGMGSFAPFPLPDEVDIGQVVRTTVAPVAKALAALGTPFIGLLYAGLMLTDQGPKVLEFNCRFGDPETQSLLPLMKTDIVEVLAKAAQGHVVRPEFEVAHCVSVVMASGGYPDAYETGLPITIPDALPSGVRIYHAGTAYSGGQLITSGGRVLTVSAVGSTRQAAREAAYSAVQSIHFPNAYYRTDVGC